MRKAPGVILDDVSLSFRKGEVIAIMGGSGMGKTTLLKLIGGLLTPDKGEVFIDGERLNTANLESLYRIRRKMGMLFQFGALFTDMTVFDNVAFPLREHTDLPEALIRDLVLLKLNAVGLRGAAQLYPSEISGGMSRRVALARTVALDPMLIMYDEPFAGLDPISMGVTAQLIRNLNTVLGSTSLIVTHDVQETFGIADYVYMISSGKVAAHGTPDELRQSKDPFVYQFVNGLPGRSRPIPVSGRTAESGAWSEMMGIFNWISSVGAWALSGVRTLGNFSRFLFRLVVNLGPSFTRFQDTLKQLYFVGNYSLVIILVSGLFVGFVLGLQGDYVLSSYGSEQALGVLVALSLLRELGPVVTALLFAGRAGTSLTAEIGLMNAGEQLSALEMMGVDPIRRILGPRFLACVISMPLLAIMFSAVGIIGSWVVAVPLIGLDSGAFWAQMQAGVEVGPDIGNGIIKTFVFGVAVGAIALYEGYTARATPEGVSSATTRTVVVSSLVVLGLDFILTAFMFTHG